MKLLKKELAKLPLAPCPKCSCPEKAHWIMTAGLEQFQGEQILTAAFYHTDEAGSPFCRIFCSRDSYVTYRYDTGKWSNAQLPNIRKGNSYVSLASDQAVFTADNSSSEIGAEYWGYSDHPDTLKAIERFQEDIAEGRRNQRDHSNQALTERIMERFPPMPEGEGLKELEQAVLDGPLSYSRYLFFWSHRAANPLTGERETRYTGYCTHCRKRMELDWIPTHKAKKSCPCCGALVTTLSRGRSRKYLQHKCHYMLFQKSRQGEVFARLLKVTRDYNMEPEQISTKFEEEERFYFSKQNAYKFVAVTTGWPHYRFTGWKKCQRVTEPVELTACGPVRRYDIHPFPKDFFNSTDLRHSRFKDYLICCTGKSLAESLSIQEISRKPMEYLALYLRYPSVEHLMASGLSRIVQEKLNWDGAARRLNWKKARPRDVLGISQPEVKLIAEAGLNSRQLEFYKELSRYLRPLTLEDIKVIREATGSYGGTYKESWIKTAQEGHLRKALNYMEKQKRRAGGNYWTIYSDWRDYLRQCEALGYDLKDQDTVFPSDLKRAHEAATKLVKYKEEKDTDDAIRERLCELGRLAYSSDAAGLMIRPAASQGELIEEGDKLHHCVGGYAKSHAKGLTSIFFIRRLSAPEEPYFTLEFRDGAVMQNRGLRNCDPPKEVKAFVKEWLEFVKGQNRKAQGIRVRAGAA